VNYFYIRCPEQLPYEKFVHREVKRLQYSLVLQTSKAYYRIGRHLCFRSCIRSHAKKTRNSDYVHQNKCLV